MEIKEKKLLILFFDLKNKHRSYIYIFKYVVVQNSDIYRLL